MQGSQKETRSCFDTYVIADPGSTTCLRVVQICKQSRPIGLLPDALGVKPRCIKRDLRKRHYQAVKMRSRIKLQY